MHQRSREVRVRHLHRVVEAPQRRTERITDSRKSTTRGGVGLKHHELLVLGLRVSRRVQVRLDDSLTRIMRKEIREDVLRVADRAPGVKLGGAIVRGVAIVIHVKDDGRRRWMESLLFDGQEREVVSICIHEPGVPDLFGGPVTGGKIGANQQLSVGGV